jgi:hypothetical protein
LTPAPALARYLPHERQTPNRRPLAQFLRPPSRARRCARPGTSAETDLTRCRPGGRLGDEPRPRRLTWRGAVRRARGLAGDRVRRRRAHGASGRGCIPMGLIGAEPFINGVAMLLGKIRDAGVENIRIHPGDVRDLFDVLPEASVSKAFLLYPDPWPKARHHRRRFVTPGAPGTAGAGAGTGAELRVATDIPDYVRQTLEEVPRHGFDWLAEGPDDWRPAMGRLDFDPLRAEGAARRARAALPDLPPDRPVPRRRLPPLTGCGYQAPDQLDEAPMSAHGDPIPMTCIRPARCGARRRCRATSRSAPVADPWRAGGGRDEDHRAAGRRGRARHRRAMRAFGAGGDAAREARGRCMASASAVSPSLRRCDRLRQFRHRRAADHGGDGDLAHHGDLHRRCLACARARWGG